ncbi:MAG: response regulator [Terriglobia bacterium]
MRRKVLVIEDESSIRNMIYVLLGALKCEGEVAYSGQQALAMIRRESFDAVLLDLRCADFDPGEVVSTIHQIRPNLVGRILFITGEVSDGQTMQFIERSCVPCVRRGRLMQELWGRLRLLLGQSPQSASTLQ